MNFTDILDLEKKISSLTKIINSASDILDTINENHQLNAMKIDEFLSKLSPSIEKVIISHAKEHSVTPKGGEIKIHKSQKEDNVLVVWEFYFLNKQNTITKISSKKTYHKSLFNSQDYLRMINGLSFEISPPKINKSEQE